MIFKVEAEQTAFEREWELLGRLLQEELVLRESDRHGARRVREAAAKEAFSRASSRGNASLDSSQSSQQKALPFPRDT